MPMLQGWQVHRVGLREGSLIVDITAVHMPSRAAGGSRVAEQQGPGHQPTSDTLAGVGRQHEAGGCSSKGQAAAASEHQAPASFKAYRSSMLLGCAQATSVLGALTGCMIGLRSECC